MILLSSFVFGLIFGSFLNVIIYRLRTRQNIIFGGSFCPECKTKLRWYDLIPLLSFVFLRGRCRYCSKAISWQYPIVELLSGLLWVFIWNLGFDIWHFIYYIFIFSSLLIIAVCDFRRKIIPNKVVYPAIVVALAYNIFSPDKGGLWGVLLTAAAAFSFFFSIYFFSKGKAMGLGDAKLAFLAGLFLSPISAVVAFTLSFIIGAIFGIILIVFGKKAFKSQIAFGPFMVIGTTAAFFFSDIIIKFLIF